MTTKVLIPTMATYFYPNISCNKFTQKEINSLTMAWGISMKIIRIKFIKELTMMDLITEEPVAARKEFSEVSCQLHSL